MEGTGIIMEKLKKHPQHKKKTPENKEMLAVDFTSPEKLYLLFSHLLEAGSKLAMQIAREDYKDYLHSLEINNHHQMVKHGTAQACHLPVQLSLQKLRGITPPGAHTFSSMLKFEYGPFHAAVIVGDVTIEWGRESIVEPRFDPIPETQFKANVANQGDWFQQEGLFQRQMSLADKQRNSHDKFEILWESMTEKSQIIEKLVSVIVDYNRNKTYSVFHCNCQHFVRDAMAALGITKPVQFHGKLQDHFDQLKRGKIKVPSELHTHENLDVYVTKNIQELGLQDMEYVQCLYFKVHLPAIEKSDDPDEWVCDIPTCKSAELDRLIGQHALPFNQFLPVPIFDHAVIPEAAFGDNVVEEKRIRKEPSLSAHFEEDEDDLMAGYVVVDSDSDMSDEVAATAFMSMSIEKQHKLAAKFSGYRDEVKLKFRDHPQYDEEKEEEFVDILTEAEQFYQYFFSSLVKNTQKVILDTSEDYKRRAGGELTWEAVCCITQERFERLCNLPMSLIYRADLKHSKPRQAVLKTPLLVSLQVGNLTFEWNKAGLVIPCKIDPAFPKPVTTERLVLVRNLDQQSQWNQSVTTWTSQINEAIEKKDEDAVIAVMYDLFEKREKMILSLIQLITNYNRYKHYHRKQCSNNHFVEEAMENLGILNPRTVSMTLRNYLETLAPNSAIADKHFPAHYDLDLYLFENIGGKMVGKEELEFLVSKYFMFHMEGCKGKRVNEWTCTEPSCQLLDLLKKL